MRNETDDCFNVTNEQIIAVLREEAVRNATIGEYSPYESLFWIAADRIEDLIAVIRNENMPELLRKLAQHLDYLGMQNIFKISNTETGEKNDNV